MLLTVTKLGKSVGTCSIINITETEFEYVLMVGYM